MISVKSSSFWAAMLSSFLIVALLFSPVSASADFRPDVSFLSASSFSLSTLPSALGTAYVTRAALGALGIEIAGSLPQLSPADVAQAIWAGGGSTLPPNYTYIQSLAEYLNRETIRIRPNSVTIGGVEYSDVWLPHDAADKFRTNAFDFTTRYNISSESTGTFVSGSGFAGGIPMFQLNSGKIRSQTVVMVAGSSWGPYSYNLKDQFIYVDPVTGTVYTRSNSFPTVPLPWELYLQVNTGSTATTMYRRPSGSTKFSAYGVESPLYEPSSFDFTWVAGTIPADPLPYDSGMRLRVPSTIVSSLPTILDPSSDTYDADLSSLISGIESSASDGTLTDPAFESWEAPVSNTIADEPYSSLSGSLSGISELLHSISTSVSNVAEAILSGDTSFFGNIVSALAAPFEPIFSIFRSGVGIWRYVVSWVGSISAPFSWSLSALSGAGSIFMTPIYAAAAGAVVLAVYKKFGR